jgi:hypothetical protein
MIRLLLLFYLPFDLLSTAFDMSHCVAIKVGSGFGIGDFGFSLPGKVIVLDPDPHGSPSKLKGRIRQDPDPHQCDKLYPDPYQSDKQDPDPNNLYFR